MPKFLQTRPPSDQQVETSRLHFRHLINGYTKNTNRLYALEAALGMWSETWPDGPEKAEVVRVLKDLASGEMDGVGYLV